MAIRRVMTKVRVTATQLSCARWSEGKVYPGDKIQCMVKAGRGSPVKAEDMVFRVYLKTRGSRAWSPLPSAVTEIRKDGSGFSGDFTVPRVEGAKICFFAWSREQPRTQAKSRKIAICQRKPIKITKVDSHFLPGRENLRVFGKIPRWVKFIRVEVRSQARTRRGRGKKPVHFQVLPVMARKGLLYLWNGVCTEGELKDKPLTLFDSPYSIRMIAAAKKEDLDPEVDRLATVPSNGRPFHLEIGRLLLFYAPDPKKKEFRPLRGTVPILKRDADDGTVDEIQADEGSTLKGVTKEKVTVVAKVYLKSRKKAMGRRGSNLVAFTPELLGRSRPKIYWRQFSKKTGKRGEKKEAATTFEVSEDPPFPGEVVKETDKRHRSRANPDKAWRGYAGIHLKPDEKDSGPFAVGAIYPRYLVQRQSTRLTRATSRYARFRLKWLEVLPRVIDLAWGEEPSSGTDTEIFGVVKGVPPGSSAVVEIYEKGKKVKSIPAKVSASGSVLTSWKYEYDEDIKQVGGPRKGPKQPGPFTFKIKAKGMESEAREIAMNDAVQFQLEDEDGEPLTNQAYKLTLSDGSTVEGISDGKGMIFHEGVPAGRCDLELIVDDDE